MISRTIRYLATATVIVCTSFFSHAQEENEGSFYNHRLKIEVEEQEVPGEAGAKGLILKAKITSQEHLVNYKELEMQAIVAGRYGGPKRRLARRKERMVLNQTRKFDLDAGKTYTFTSELMESGRGNPNHPHFGVFYEGYLIVVKDRYGKIVASDTNFKPLTERYPEITNVEEGDDFKAYVLINR